MDQPRGEVVSAARLPSLRSSPLPPPSAGPSLLDFSIRAFGLLVRLLREDLTPRRASERRRAELLPFRAWAPLDHANGTSGDAHTVGLPGRFSDGVHAQLAPLVAELGHARRDVERLAEEKGRLESMVAALTYENARLVDEIARLEQPGGTNPQPPGPVGGEVMPEFEDERGKARRSGGPLGRWTP